MVKKMVKLDERESSFLVKLMNETQDKNEAFKWKKRLWMKLHKSKNENRGDS